MITYGKDLEPASLLFWSGVDLVEALFEHAPLAHGLTDVLVRHTSERNRYKKCKKQECNATHGGERRQLESNGGSSRSAWLPLKCTLEGVVESEE